MRARVKAAAVRCGGELRSKLNRSSVLAIVAARHAEHVRLGGTEHAPSSSASTRELIKTARRLEQKNAALREARA